MSHRATLHDVAAQAGVSVASASRALIGGSASLEMISKVRRAAKQLGYVPDATARSLRMGGTRQVVFAVDDIGNLNYVAMLRAIEHEFTGAGIRLNVTATGRSERQTLDLVRSMNSGAGDGLIISPLRVTPALRRALLETVVPVVVIGSLHRDVAIDVVSVDSALAVELAVAHLVATGRRRIAFLNGPLDTHPGASRRRGYLAGLAAAGMTPDESVVEVADDFTIEAGRRSTALLIERRPSNTFDAIVAANDLLAVGAISTCLASGVGVPDEVAVTGIDDTEFAASYNPSITSVSIGSAERGKRAARLLLERFAEPTLAPRTSAVHPSLIARASTGVTRGA